MLGVVVLLCSVLGSCHSMGCAEGAFEFVAETAFRRFHMAGSIAEPARHSADIVLRPASIVSSPTSHVRVCKIRTVEAI